MPKIKFAEQKLPNGKNTEKKLPKDKIAENSSPWQKSLNFKELVAFSVLDSTDNFFQKLTLEGIAECQKRKSIFLD